MAAVFIVKPEQDPAVREGKYTGSNVAGCIGSSRWSHPNKEFDILLGKRVRDDLSENPYVKAGIWAEEQVGKRFAKEMGLKIRFVNRTYVSKEWDLATGHIDAKIQGQNVGLEIKTASEFKKKEYSEHLAPNPVIPIEYRCQINHYLYITGWDFFYLAVLIGGNDFRVFKIERDEKAIAEQVRKLRAFHENHVVLELSPPARTPEEALYIFPSADPEEKSIDASPLFLNLYAEAKQIAEEGKILKWRKAENEANMQNMMEDATYVNHPSSKERLVQWKNGSRSSLNQKALRKDMPELWHNEKYVSKSTFRTFKIITGETNGNRDK
tara:strand:+ start:1680 stop:2654 length:975 start_codon:yes stop_codon:yes gene_type:complete